jgi:hypothetical protein
MKVFSAYDDVKGKNGTLHAGASKTVNSSSKKAQVKPEPSAQEKDEKIAKLKQEKDDVVLSKKSAAAAVSKKEIFNLNHEKAVEAEPEKETIVKSDISKNDPNDPVTKEKLKDVLSRGAMNFNGSERKVLESILTDA